MFIAQRVFRPLETTHLDLLIDLSYDTGAIFERSKKLLLCSASVLGSEPSGEDSCGINILPLWKGHSDWPLLTKLVYRNLEPMIVARSTTLFVGIGLTPKLEHCCSRKDSKLYH